MKSLNTLFCLFALVVTTTCIGQTHVATVTKYTGSSTATISQAFGGASTTGNLIVVHLSWDNKTRTVSSITDNKGNVYTSINGPTTWNSTNRSELYYAYNIVGGGTAITVTATLSGVSTSYFQIYMTEYSGISTTDPLDQHSVNIGGTSAVSSGSKTTLFTNELVYGVSIGAAGLLTTGATFANRSTANQNIVEDKKAVTTGSYAATFSSAGGNWVAEMATFKPHTLLPVDLISFDASIVNGNAVKLDWVTAAEMNNDHFEIQHSHDGSDWVLVKQIKGEVNSGTTLHYSATDNTPYPGLSYYRLVQYDIDGNSSYSKTVTIRTDAISAEKIKIYPNPAVSFITVEGDKASLQSVVILNALGEPMNGKTQLIRDNDLQITLNLSTLPKGVYFMKTKNKCLPFYKE